VIEEMNGWAVRPVDETYAAIFIDAIVVKVRDGQHVDDISNAVYLASDLSRSATATQLTVDTGATKV
jgi:transposase-like protein